MPSHLNSELKTIRIDKSDRINIANKPAIRREIYWTLSSKYGIQAFLEGKPGFIIFFNMVDLSTNSSFDPSLKQVYNQILSTFKFTP